MSIKSVSSHLPSEDVNAIVNCQFVIIIILRHIVLSKIDENRCKQTVASLP